MRQTTCTVILLFTDVENSTSLWESWGERMSCSLRRHNALLEEAVSTHGGTLFKQTGDGIAAAFPSAAPALLAAISAQQHLLSDSWDEGCPPLRVRMGLHVGAPESYDGDYFGPTVNRAARLCDLGHGGQILVSQAVYALLCDAPLANATFLPLGLVELRGAQQPEAVFQVCAQGLPTTFPPLRGVPQDTTNLPELLSAFVGREEALRQVARDLKSHRLLTLRGTGGCGKTRLALEAARCLLPDYPGGVWFVRLEALEEDALVVAEIARSLNIRPKDGESAIEALQRQLRWWAKGDSLLLALDNCEHLRDACARLLATLLPACPNLRVLTTSREPLGVPGEMVREVPPLAIPLRSAGLQRLRTCEAVQLFMERVSEAGGPRLNRKNAAAVGEICRRLDGIPLAIELAARWTGAISLEEILGDLRGITDEPMEGGLVSDRHRTMNAALDWSFCRLGDEAAALFLRLAVFVGGFTFEAVLEVMDGDGDAVPKIRRLLKSLVDRSLVVFDESARPEPRYRLLEPVRQYATAKLEECGGRDAARQRHLAWYFELAQRAEPELQRPNQKVWLERLKADHDNLRAALRWSVEPERRLRLATSLWRFWSIGGYYAEGRGWLEGALNRTPEGDADLRSRAWNACGILASRQGDQTAARSHFEQSLTCWEQTGDSEQRRNALVNLAGAEHALGDYDAARRRYVEALAQYQAEGNSGAAAAAVLNNLAVITMQDGDLDGAAPQFEEALRIYRDSGDSWRAAMALFNLGLVGLKRGELEGARKQFLEAFALQKALGDRTETAMCLIGLGRVEYAAGHFKQAVRLLGASEALRKEVGASLDASSQRIWEEITEDLRKRLGTQPYQQLWKAGEARSWEQTWQEAEALDNQ